ncbi:MAG: T9SS type A sorting domain-containing protein [Fluviicola sp.]|nr:T9SS type A sorting domain-containing protein [Fluviicola sp.]
MKTCYPSAVKSSTSTRYIAFDTNASRFTTFIHHIRFSAIVLSASTLMTLFATCYAQVNAYSYSTSTGVTLETGTFTNLLGTFLDDDVSATTGIGFTFTYNGTNYTTFSATSNGLFQLGGSAVTDYNNVIGNLTGPYLIPYWDDNYTDANGNVQYQLKGAPGSRKLIVEYNLSYLGNTGAADKRFQIWLFETSNIVQFVYGAGNNFNGGYSVGILSNGLTDFQSVTVATNTRSIVTTNDNNTTWPGSGRAYIFNPAAGLPVNFNAFEYTCQDKTIELNWETVSEFNCDRYELEISRDGLDYQLVTTVNGNGTTTLPSNYAVSIPKNNEIQYARLRQVDTDGESVIYGPFSLMCEATDIVIYPNPARDETYLICPKKEQEATIEIYDCNATLVYSTIHDFKKSTMTTIDLHELKAGTYLLKLIALDETSVHLIIKE